MRRVLVVGAGRLGRAVVDKLAEHPEAGLRAIGFVDDDPGKHGLAYRGVAIVGETKDAARVVEERRVDAVFLALPLEAHRAMLDVLKDVARTVADVRVVPDLLQHITFRAGVEDLDGLPVVHLTQVPLTGWMSLVKRTLDLGIATAALVVLSPLFGAIAVAIRLTGKPILYRQSRMGLDGRPFEILKFRSMRPGAEDELGPTWAAPEDPRRTRVGQFLRRWSLDELPQLVNVLKGEMSLVGPRPERPEFVREFKEKFPQYMVRHRVRAGMTGWAQVHGWRGATDLQGHVRAGAQVIVEALANQARSGARASLGEVVPILPGLGEPEAFRLELGNAAVGKTLAELDLRGLTGATVLVITRPDGAGLVPTAHEVLRAGDILALAGSHEALDAAKQLLAGG